MSAVLNPVSSIKPAHMLVSVLGRIESARSFDGRTFTKLTCPAADAYSKPQVVEVRSSRRLGQRGEEITVSCQLGGYNRKAFESKDRETGEITRVVPVDHTLDLVE